MRRLLTTLAALALTLTAFAQPGRQGGGMGHGPNFGTGLGRGGYYMDAGTFELGITLNHFTGGTKDGISVERPDRVGIFGEYRADIGGIMDMGLQLSTTFGKGTEGLSEMSYWQGAPLFVMDFNILPYYSFNPYVGVGIGPGFGYEKNKTLNDSQWTHALVLNPRVGIELFETLRMSVQYQWYLNESRKYSNLAFGFSVAFGHAGRGRGRW